MVPVTDGKQVWDSGTFAEGGTARGLGQGEGLSMCSSPGSLGSRVLEEAGLITHRRKENASMGATGHLSTRVSGRTCGRIWEGFKEAGLSLGVDAVRKGSPVYDWVS